MTELQLYRYIKEELRTCKDELNWHDDKLILQMPPDSLQDFMVFAKEDDSEEPIEITYYHGRVQIDLVPICDSFSIDPENILAMEV